MKHERDCSSQLTIVFGNGGQYSLEPTVSGLQELEPQLQVGEDVHATQESHHAQARRQLDGPAELLEELLEHQVHGRLHVRADGLRHMTVT